MSPGNADAPGRAEGDETSRWGPALGIESSTLNRCSDCHHEALAALADVEKLVAQIGPGEPPVEGTADALDRYLMGANWLAFTRVGNREEA